MLIYIFIPKTCIFLFYIFISPQNIFFFLMFNCIILFDFFFSHCQTVESLSFTMVLAIFLYLSTSLLEFCLSLFPNCCYCFYYPFPFCMSLPIVWVKYIGILYIIADIQIPLYIVLLLLILLIPHYVLKQKQLAFYSKWSIIFL